MKANMSSTYFQFAKDCEQAADASPLANVKSRQSNAASAWRIMAERAQSAEHEAAALAAWKAERAAQITQAT